MAVERLELFWSGVSCFDFFGRGRHPFVCLIGIAPEQRTARRKNARTSVDATTVAKPG
jgi:allophanate hydrolase subunit 1